MISVERFLEQQGLQPVLSEAGGSAFPLAGDCRTAESNPAADRFCAMMKKTRRSVRDTRDTQGVSWLACREP